MAKVNSEKRREKTEKVLSSLMGKNVPVITQENYKVSLINALNYHNVFTDAKELRRAVVSYVKSKGKKDYLAAIDQTSDNDLRQLGVIIMHLERGDYIAPKEILFLERTLDKIKASYKAPVVEIKSAIKENKQKDKVLDQARLIASAIDAEVDLLFTKKSTGEFSIDTLLKTNNATEAVSKKIASFYDKQIEEFKLLVSGDAELKESYSLTKPHAKRMLTFLESVVSACLQNAATAKAQKVRKPRAKKKKSPQALVAKLQYMKDFAELKLKSIDPKDIIGSKTLWIYNTKYKKLTKLVSDTSEGLTVKGTTIIGFNIEQSECKRVRKPEVIFGEVSKKNLAFHMKKLKTKECEVNGRVNKETILLTV